MGEILHFFQDDCASGERVRGIEPRGHDCEFCRKRASLVPTAVEIANELGDVDPYAWTRRFVAAMEELAKRRL
jgi:hypothetical protein